MNRFAGAFLGMLLIAIPLAACSSSSSSSSSDATSAASADSSATSSDNSGDTSSSATSSADNSAASTATAPVYPGAQEAMMAANASPAPPAGVTKSYMTRDPEAKVKAWYRGQSLRLVKSTPDNAINVFLIGDAKTGTMITTEGVPGANVTWILVSPPSGQDSWSWKP